MARPFRYTFILVLVAAGTALAAVGGWRYARASAPVSGPIILVSIDALRADRLPIYGYSGIRTPTFDALGADGVVFERAYSHAPQSLPAHASLLSGRLPFETGVRDNVGFTVKDGERMLAEILSDRDYATAGVVSSFALRKDTGIGQGFSFFDDDLPPPGDDGIEPLERNGELSERTAEAWLQAGHTTRSFLFLHLPGPRHPYTSYDDEVVHVDQIVGRLVRYLKTHQLYDQSTIIIVSDHGEGLGDHGEQAHGLFVYDEDLRVPLIVKQAAGEGAGRRVRDLVQHVDLVPTILDLARAPEPGNLHGRSLKPLLDGTGALPDRTIYSESLYGLYHFGWSGLTSVTDGRHRYINAPREELYDLEADPGETDNLVDERPEIATTMRAALDRLLAGSEVPAQREVATEARERLIALGYVGTIENKLVGPKKEDALLDPKDVRDVVETYRAAVERDAAREWAQAIGLFQSLLLTEPASVDVWLRLAAVADRADRHDLAIDAYQHVIALVPDDVRGHLGLASIFFKNRQLEDASHHAAIAVSVAASEETRISGSAHELLARIALARRDNAAARSEAALAEEIEPGRSLENYIEGRILQDQRRYDDALELFEHAAVELGRAHGRPISELHASTAQTLVRLERYSEAEYHFLEELRSFPMNARARADLAALYHVMGRTDEAARALDDLVRISPTPDAYLLAARTWTTFGEPKRAAVLRAEAQLRFPTATRRSPD